MDNVAVIYAKYPEHAEAARKHADPDASTDTYAVMPKSSWEAIQAGREPSTKPKRRKRTRSRIDPPGTFLTNLIRAATFGLIRPCTSCKSRASKLDRMGWRGVLTLGAWR